MRLRFLFWLIPLLLLSLLAGSVVYLGSSAGLSSALRLLSWLSQDRLHIDAAHGALAGPLDIDSLRWQDGAQSIVVRQVHLDWSPAALWQARQLHVRALTLAEVRVDTPPSSEPARLPDDLQLPFALKLDLLRIDRLLLSGAPALDQLQLTLDSDGEQHHLRQLSGQSSGIRFSGQGELAGASPFASRWQVQLESHLEDKALALELAAEGPLARLNIQAHARRGITGSASAIVTPFQQPAFASARLQLTDIDPAAWHPAAPQAQLDLTADLLPEGDGFVGSFGLSNRQPGRLDQQRLPLETLAGALRWQSGQLALSALHATLPGRGELSGLGEVAGEAAKLTLNVRNLDLLHIDRRLRSTRLAGEISLQAAGPAQQVQLHLRDPRFTVDGDLQLDAQRLELRRLALRAGQARLEASGHLDRDPASRFAASGTLSHFNPAEFARVTPARLNSSFQISGHLQPRPVVDAEFSLQDSQLAGQAFAGQGALRIDWPRIPRADIRLQAGANRLAVSGAFGQPGDTLHGELHAPDLSPLGLSGDLDGQFDLAGSLEHPSLQARLNSRQIAQAGSFRIQDLKLLARLDNAAKGLVQAELQLGQLDTPAQLAALSALEVKIDGRRDAHQIVVSSQLARQHRLRLRAQGGWLGSAGWQGQLLEGRWQGESAAQQAQLTQPAALALAAEQWLLGPLTIAHPTASWEAKLQASARNGQLAIKLDARQGAAEPNRGGRNQPVNNPMHGQANAGVSGGVGGGVAAGVAGELSGEVSAELQAGLRSPWQLDPLARWQGRLRLRVDRLDPFGPLLGEGWTSKGRLAGEFTLGGYPDRPRLDGQLNGQALSLQQRDQGLALTDGQLDLRLSDNLLRIAQLSFSSPHRPPPAALRLAVGEQNPPLAAAAGRLSASGQFQFMPDKADGQGWIDLTLDRVGAWQLPEQWLSLSGQNRIGWQNGALTLHGRLAVDAAYWQLAPAGAPRLSDDVVVRHLGGTPPVSRRPALELDISTDLGRNFLFETAGLSTRLAGNVRLQASGRDLPRASGRIRTQDGRFAAYGQKLDIERGQLTFQGLLDDPALDVRAVRKGLPVEAGVQVSGTAQRPIIKLVSEPSVPDAEKLSWLILGHAPQQSGRGDAALLLAAAGGLLGNESGGVVQQVKQNFGLDEIGIRQGELGESGGPASGSRVAGSGVDSNASAGQQIFSVSKRLSETAWLSYEQALGKTESIVKLSIDLGRRLTLVGRAGSDNAVDLFYTLTFGRPPGDPKRRPGKTDSTAP